jgi:hypothetical protein
MIGGVVNNALNAAFSQTENFEGGMMMGSPANAAIVSLLTALLMFSLILFVGQWLWNNTLAVLVPAVKPAKSVWQVLGLAILISLMNPCGCSKF